MAELMRGDNVAAATSFPRAEKESIRAEGDGGQSGQSTGPSVSPATSVATMVTATAVTPTSHTKRRRRRQRGKKGDGSRSQSRAGLATVRCEELTDVAADIDTVPTVAVASSGDDGGSARCKSPTRAVVPDGNERAASLARGADGHLAPITTGGGAASSSTTIREQASSTSVATASSHSTSNPALR